MLWLSPLAIAIKSTGCIINLSKFSVNKKLSLLQDYTQILGNRKSIPFSLNFAVVFGRNAISGKRPHYLPQRPLLHPESPPYRSETSVRRRCQVFAYLLLSLAATDKSCQLNCCSLAGDLSVFFRCHLDFLFGFGPLWLTLTLIESQHGVARATFHLGQGRRLTSICKASKTAEPRVHISVWAAMGTLARWLR